MRVNSCRELCIRCSHVSLLFLNFIHSWNDFNSSQMHLFQRRFYDRELGSPRWVNTGVKCLVSSSWWTVRRRRHTASCHSLEQLVLLSTSPPTQAVTAARHLTTTGHRLTPVLDYSNQSFLNYFWIILGSARGSDISFSQDYDLSNCTLWTQYQITLFIWSRNFSPPLLILIIQQCTTVWFLT